MIDIEKPLNEKAGTGAASCTARAMTRRERLMATLRGETVDRPAFSFYEINGFDQSADDTDPFNIYSDPSWRPLLELASEKTDRIIRRDVPCVNGIANPMREIAEEITHIENGSRITVTTIQAGNRTLTSRTRRNADVDTVWTDEHLLKDTEDLMAFFNIPFPQFTATPDISDVLEAEKKLGDSGIIMIDTPDPLCCAAALFDMAAFTIIAMAEPVLFERLISRFAEFMIAKTKAIAEALPGRLWRIYGPEYASPPYLPPYLFKQYVCKYDTPMVQAIQKNGGYARIHSHGNLHDILDDIVSMNPAGLDPIEPPPQGDIELKYVREKYGKNMVLFGNLEASDIENLPTSQFAEKAMPALDEGTCGSGRGFVLMPSACPYGRKLPSLAAKNYEAIVEIAEKW
jgi:uroporphyrinogen-III decarboxylase